MLELLVIYSLNKREQTLYGLGKSIAELFGEISNPSHGALHPALKRLMAENVVEIRKNMSDGGKRYTYYSLTKNWKPYFEEKFLNINSTQSETAEAYLLELKAKLLVSDIAEKSILDEFKEKNILKLSKYKEGIEQRLNNPYIEYSSIQKEILGKIKEGIETYRKIVDGVA